MNSQMFCLKNRPKIIIITQDLLDLPQLKTLDGLKVYFRKGHETRFGIHI